MCEFRGNRAKHRPIRSEKVGCKVSVLGLWLRNPQTKTQHLYIFLQDWSPDSSIKCHADRSTAKKCNTAAVRACWVSELSLIQTPHPSQRITFWRRLIYRKRNNKQYLWISCRHATTANRAADFASGLKLARSSHNPIQTVLWLTRRIASLLTTGWSKK